MAFWLIASFFMNLSTMSSILVRFSSCGSSFFCLSLPSNRLIILIILDIKGRYFFVEVVSLFPSESVQSCFFFEVGVVEDFKNLFLHPGSGFGVGYTFIDKFKDLFQSFLGYHVYYVWYQVGLGLFRVSELFLDLFDQAGAAFLERSGYSETNAAFSKRVHGGVGIEYEICGFLEQSFLCVFSGVCFDLVVLDPSDNVIPAKDIGEGLCFFDQSDVEDVTNRDRSPTIFSLYICLLIFEG